MKGSKILLTTPARGNKEGGQITDTSSPGMFMEVVPGSGGAWNVVASMPGIAGRKNWRARSTTTGGAAGVTLLLEDYLQGALGTTAYTANTLANFYWPIAGDECNVLVQDVAGTADFITQGDLFGIQNNGMLHANASYTSAPWKAMESLQGLIANTLVWMQYQGNQA
jgi:hypothetical protein